MTLPTYSLPLADDAAGDLRIGAIRATPVNIPLKAAYQWSVGYFPGFSKTIVVVETESGVVGVGEAPSSWSTGLIEHAIAPRLIGADPRDLADCERRAVPPIQAMRNADDESVLRAYGGVEMALWDLNGRIQTRAVAELLGGFVRTEIPYTAYFAPRMANGPHGGETTPAEIAAYCARMQEEPGARAFEGKVGLGDLEFEIAMVREIRAAVGEEPKLRLDANMGWSVITAREALRRLEPFNISSVEDPAATLIELAHLRLSTSIAFSTHNQDLSFSPTHGVPDAVVVGLGAVGGISKTVALAHVCQHLGVDLWFLQSGFRRRECRLPTGCRGARLVGRAEPDTAAVARRRRRRGRTDCPGERHSHGCPRPGLRDRTRPCRDASLPPGLLRRRTVRPVPPFRSSQLRAATDRV